MNVADTRDVMLHSINYYLHYNKSSKLQRSVIFIETSQVKTLAPAERYINYVESLKVKGYKICF